MPAKNHSDKRLVYIAPENRAELEKRAPRVAGGRNSTVSLNSIIARYVAFCDAGLRRVWSALPDERDRAFIRHVLMGIATDDLTLTENPTAYLRDIEEAAAECETGEEPFTSALMPTLQRFGPLEALALVDWIEQEKARR